MRAGRWVFDTGIMSTDTLTRSPQHHTIKLRLGQLVSAEEVEFGELADIVVDPVSNTVTHVVVEPHHRHQQARLVPIALLEANSSGAISIRLDVEQVRQLPKVSFSEYVPLASPIDVGDEWDIVGQTVIAQPYWGGDVLGMGRSWSEQAQVSFDRVPKGECEIRRDSRVLASDRKAVGHVEGLVVDEEHVGGVVVRTGLPGLHHLVVVPLGAVHLVANDSIELSIDRAAFDRMPSTDDLYAPFAGASMPSPIRAQIAMGLHHLSRRVRGLKRPRGRATQT